jgi:hypothetical protein
VTQRRFAVGVGIGALYALVAILTIQSSGSHVRPLFEGIGPNRPYQWVNPPKAFAVGNVKPHANDAQVVLGPNGSELSGAGSTDTQIVLNLPEAAIPPQPPDDHVTATFTPLDPATLGPAPSGLRANGNAYRVELSYEPSGQPIDVLAKPGNVVLTVPEPSQGLLYSPDGKSWQKLESQDLGGVGTVGATFDKAGYYAGATSSFTAPADGAGSGSSGIGGIVVVGGITVALALGLGFGPSLLRRAKRRRRRSDPAVVRAARTQRATARQPKRKQKRKGTGRSRG